MPHFLFLPFLRCFIIHLGVCFSVYEKGKKDRISESWNREPRLNSLPSVVVDTDFNPQVTVFVAFRTWNQMRVK